MEDISPLGPPKRILLATDLSGSSDRALDRATLLANHWDAELHIVHALDTPAEPDHHGLPSWRRPPDDRDRVERQIRDDIRGNCPRLKIHLSESPPIAAILDTIEQEQCDLVVVGLGRSRVFGWPPLGKTINELFRRSPVSVLVVKKRPQGPYQRLLIGADFSVEARSGLEAAARLFPQSELHVMHAFELPYRALLLDSQLSRDFGEMERTSLREFVAEADLPETARGRIQTLIEHGPPEAMLSAYATERGADLCVIGAYERSLLFHTVVIGKGPRIVDAAPCDILVVRATRDAQPRG